MFLKSYFPFSVLNKKTILSKKFSDFLSSLFVFTKIFVFNDAQTTEGGK